MHRVLERVGVKGVNWFGLGTLVMNVVNAIVEPAQVQNPVSTEEPQVSPQGHYKKVQRLELPSLAEWLELPRQDKQCHCIELHKQDMGNASSADPWEVHVLSRKKHADVGDKQHCELCSVYAQRSYLMAYLLDVTTPHTSSTSHF